MTVGLLLFDLEPDPPRFPAEAWEPAPPPGRTRFALESMHSVVTTPLRGARAAGGVVPALRALGDESMRWAGSSSLNGEIGPRRTLVGHRLDLGDVARVKRAHDVTHNDVCLAMVASALRELEVAAGRVPRPVKAMVPVSVRCDDDAGTLGNRISFAFVDLPLHEASGSLRLKGIHAVTAAFKRARRPAGVAALLGAADAVPPLLRGPLVRALAGPRTYNLVVSNVPGPEHPLYVLGAELLDAYPVVPLSEGHALSIGAFTYRGAVHIGLYADPEALPGVNELPGALDRGLAGLLPARPVRPVRPARPAIAGAFR